MGVPAKRRYPYEPDYAVPPGDTLQETIDALGMNQKELAVRTGLTAKTVNRIIKGIDPISQRTAIKFERATGVPARMWNNLEMNYRETLARLADEQRLRDDLEWLKQIPTRTLLKWGLIEQQSDRLSLLQEVLAFFGVDSPKDWENLWCGRLAASFRKSDRFATELGPTAAWLRWGERDAQEIPTEPFSKTKFRDALGRVRALTTKPPEVFQPKTVELCASAGVAVAFVPEIRGCPAWGAARWLTPKKALLQVSLRYKSDDHLWLSFFHEAGHILNDRKRAIIVDDGEASDDSEERANKFAADFLIPPQEAKHLPTLKREASIKRFAKSIGIAPGIVVGRMQKERLIKFSHYNGLKQCFEWEKP